MRRKHNLDERIDSCGEYLLACEHEFTNSNDYIKNKEYLDFLKVFNNSNPVEMDLGCGLGSFLVEIAKQNPNTNYIGVEKFSNVIISAIDKANKEHLPNIKFLNIRVECLPKFIKSNSISKMYLNFSNPLPNISDERKRLTYKRFLDIYKDILIDGGQIIQKTDNRGFFDFSIKSFSENGFKVSDINYDLANNPIKGNIKTEHEDKYIKDGRTIHRLVATKN